jgi:hypothetical protein
MAATGFPKINPPSAKHIVKKAMMPEPADAKGMASGESSDGAAD